MPITEPKVMSSNVLFCPTNCPNPKDIQSAIIDDIGNQQISKYQNLKPDICLCGQKKRQIVHQNCCPLDFCEPSNHLIKNWNTDDK